MNAAYTKLKILMSNICGSSSFQQVIGNVSTHEPDRYVSTEYWRKTQQMCSMIELCCMSGFISRPWEYFECTELYRVISNANLHSMRLAHKPVFLMSGFAERMRNSRDKLYSDGPSWDEFCGEKLSLPSSVMFYNKFEYFNAFSYEYKINFESIHTAMQRFIMLTTRHANIVDRPLMSGALQKMDANGWDHFVSLYTSPDRILDALLGSPSYDDLQSTAIVQFDRYLRFLRDLYNFLNGIGKFLVLRSAFCHYCTNVLPGLDKSFTRVTLEVLKTISDWSAYSESVYGYNIYDECKHLERIVRTLASEDNYMPYMNLIRKYPDIIPWGDN